MITIQDQHLLCTNCGGRHRLSIAASHNVRMCDAFKVLHHNCDKFTASKTDIVAAIESVSRITLEQIRSKSRNRKVVDARKVLCGLLDERESMNSVEIADYIGCHLSSGLPDHPTALHHIRTDKVLNANNPTYRDFRAQITKWI